MIGILLREALQSLLVSPIRSFLTILGVIIGISSVVMFMALGEGLRRDVEQEIVGLGSNLLLILPSNVSDGNFNPNLISGDILKIEDVTRLDALPVVAEISPVMLLGGVLRHDQTMAPSAVLLGQTPAF